MLAANTTLVLSGIACLGASGVLTYRLGARHDSPSFFTRTEGRAVAVALLLVLAFTAGLGLLAKGVVG